MYYIPHLKSNIVSLGQLDENGCKVIIEDGHLYIFDRQQRLLTKVKKSGNQLYKMNLNMAEPICLLGAIKESSWLWHARYGHLNFQALRKLAKLENGRRPPTP